MRAIDLKSIAYDEIQKSLLGFCRLDIFNFFLNIVNQWA